MWHPEFPEVKAEVVVVALFRAPTKGRLRFMTTARATKSF